MTIKVERNKSLSQTIHLLSRPINKGSHSIRKPPSSSSSSSSSSSTSFMTPRTPPRRPVIIYTHSPKVIHTTPQDFMALVQKLTGLPRSENEGVPHSSKPEKGSIGKDVKVERDIPKRSPCVNDEDNNECTFMMTDENRCTIGDGNVMSSSYVPFCDNPPNTPFNNMSLCHISGSNDLSPFYNYDDSLLLMPNMQTSFSSSQSFGSITEFSDF